MADGPTDDEAPTTTSGWRRLLRAVRRGPRGQALTAVLLGVLGFALVVQVQQTRGSTLSALRQPDLLRLLDEVTQRSDQLEREASQLEATREDLVSGSDTRRAALEAATQREQTQGILAGQLPAEGPGIDLVVSDPRGKLTALTMVTIVEELRNAGAEAIQLGDQRIVASSAFVDGQGGVEVNGTAIEAPYRWLAIGDPDTLVTALNIPGGALAEVKSQGGSAVASPRDSIEVTATREVSTPQFATPEPVGEPEG